MANWTTLPHENLIAYRVARELVVMVREAKISDAKLRDQAMRAATSACLNIAEAAGRVSAADKARVYGIARGERSEEHTSELQSHVNLVCRLLLEKKKKKQ